MKRSLIAFSIALFCAVTGAARAEAQRGAHSPLTIKDCNDLATSARIIAKARDAVIDPQKLVAASTAGNRELTPRLVEMLRAQVTVVYGSTLPPDELASGVLMDCVHRLLSHSRNGLMHGQLIRLK
jgi:purine nucleoside phosphorylase